MTQKPCKCPKRSKKIYYIPPGQYQVTFDSTGFLFFVTWIIKSFLIIYYNILHHIEVPIICNQCSFTTLNTPLLFIFIDCALIIQSSPDLPACDHVSAHEVAPVHRVKYQEEDWRQEQKESVNSAILLLVHL